MCNNGAGDVVAVNDDLCIGCGECIRICSHGARVGVDDFDQWMQDLKNGTDIVAIVAPAIVATFGESYLKFNSFLKKLGIKAVFDVSFGAELTVRSYVEYKKSEKPELMIASPCPVLVSFIEIYQPSLLKFLVPRDSPMVHMMKVIRNDYPQYSSYKIAAISPCYAKRREFDSAHIGDYNVTFRSIQQYMKEQNENIELYHEEPYVNPPAERGVRFSMPGGLMRTVERYDPDIVSHTRKVEGCPDVYDHLSYLSSLFKKNPSDQRFAPTHSLVDCLNCRLGCNGGPGTLNQKKHVDEIERLVEARGVKALKFHRKTLLSKKMFERTLSKYWIKGLFDRTFTDRSELFRKALKRATKEELAEIHKKMYKTAPEHFLECASCGYASCEQMAFALFNHLNKFENCRHYAWKHDLEKEKQTMQKHMQDLDNMIIRVRNHMSEEVMKSLDGIDLLVQSVHKTDSTVKKSYTIIKSMIGNITTIFENIERNTETIKQLNNLSIDGKNSINSINTLIANVSTHYETLIQASKIISHIANDTNILGINAAIEASRAKESGKGFNVVAEEIRQLAKNSHYQAQDIEQILNDVKKLIDKSNKSSVQAQDKFDSIMSLVESIKNEDETIFNEVKIQNDTGTQVTDALNEINQFTETIKQESEQLLRSIQSLLNDINLLKKD
jgi:iron only hydrogenase large subunit-like protein